MRTLLRAFGILYLGLANVGIIAAWITGINGRMPIALYCLGGTIVLAPIGALFLAVESIVEATGRTADALSALRKPSAEKRTERTEPAKRPVGGDDRGPGNSMERGRS